MRALVTGASGFTGGALCALLVGRGAAVRGLVRASSDTRALEALGVERVVHDLADEGPLDAAVADIDTVFHVAAAWRSERLPLSAYWDVNVGGTRRLLEAAGRARVGRFVHTSTVGVQGHIDEGPASEEYRFGPGDHYQESKRDAEVLARDFGRSTGLPVAVVRPAGIYGPGDDRFLKLFRFIGEGRFRMIGSGEVHYHFTYIDDLVRGIALAGEHPDAAGEVFTLGGRESVSLNDLVALIARILGAPDPGRRRHIPVAPVMAAAAACEAICRPLGIQPPLYRRRVDFFTHHRSFDVSKAERVLGFRAEVPLEDGLRRLADWFRAEGMLGGGDAAVD